MMVSTWVGIMRIPFLVYFQAVVPVSVTWIEPVVLCCPCAVYGAPLVSRLWPAPHMRRVSPVHYSMLHRRPLAGRRKGVGRRQHRLRPSCLPRLLRMERAHAADDVEPHARERVLHPRWPCGLREQALVRLDSGLLRRPGTPRAVAGVCARAYLRVVFVFCGRALCIRICVCARASALWCECCGESDIVALFVM